MEISEQSFMRLVAHPVTHENLERAYSPYLFFVLKCPGALPQADMFSAFSAQFIIVCKLRLVYF
jgi:hypothetical protein